MKQWLLLGVSFVIVKYPNCLLSLVPRVADIGRGRKCTSRKWDSGLSDFSSSIFTKVTTVGWGSVLEARGNNFLFLISFKSLEFGCRRPFFQFSLHQSTLDYCLNLEWLPIWLTIPSSIHGSTRFLRWEHILNFCLTCKHWKSLKCQKGLTSKRT